MMPGDGQGALPFGHRTAYRAEDFLPAASNALARRWLARQQDWPDRRLVLWGGAGCGKTHLARIWGAAGRVLDGTALGEAFAVQQTRIVVDGADRGADEAALLHLLNAAAEAGRWVLLTGTLAPARWPVQLPDLGSRLRAAQAVGIEPPEDALLAALLVRLLAERQLAMSGPVQAWLLARLPRTAHALDAAVTRLDRLSLARSRPITRALAQAGLTDLLDPADDDGSVMMDGGLP